MPSLGLASFTTEYAGTATSVTVVEDFFFDSSVYGEVTPLAAGTVSDFHDTWDLDSTDYTPEVSPDDEGFWDTDANGDVIPLDV